MGKLTHIYPRLRKLAAIELFGKEQAQVGDLTEEDGWQMLRDVTMEVDHARDVAIINLPSTEDDWLTEKLSEKPYDSERVHRYVQPDLIKKIAIPPEVLFLPVSRTLQQIKDKAPQVTQIFPRVGYTRVRKFQRCLHLGNRHNFEIVKKILRELSDPLLVIWEPEEPEGLQFLPELQKELPHQEVMIVHCVSERCGVEVTGDPDGWEDEFPAMGEIDLPPLEVIVEDLIIKGSIHVFAGRFETYKTMALIELSAAILEGRKAFDQFTVLHRYPILFLEEDMSPEQFYDYAAPFNLTKHGEEFRVKHPKGIMHAIDSPVLQQAVCGRILILDTMLDFAQIEKAAESGEWVTFMQGLRDLMTLHGCVAVIMTAHSTKTGAKSSDIDPNEYFKDSATFGGKVDIGYGHKALPESSQIEIKRIKGRGFKKALNFTIAVYDDDGESNLSKGTFPVYQKPGEFKKGRPAKRNPEQTQKIIDFKKEGKSNYEIAEEVGVSEPTVRRILKESEFDQ